MDINTHIFIITFIIIGSFFGSVLGFWATLVLIIITEVGIFPYLFPKKDIKEEPVNCEGTYNEA